MPGGTGASRPQIGVKRKEREAQWDVRRRKDVFDYTGKDWATVEAPIRRNIKDKARLEGKTGRKSERDRSPSYKVKNPFARAYKKVFD